MAREYTPGQLIPVRWSDVVGRESRTGVSGRSGEILTLRRSGSRSGYPSQDLRIALLLRVICRGHLTSSAGIWAGLRQELGIVYGQEKKYARLQAIGAQIKSGDLAVFGNPASAAV